MDKLKPCPFCGGEASFVNCEIPPQWYVRCSNGCCEQTKLYLSKAEAKKAWNRRVVPADLTVCGYDVRSLIALSLAAAEAGVTEENLKEFARNWESAYQFVREESLRIFEESIGKINRWEDKDER